MQWLAALCVRRPVFASVLILSLTVIGVFSFAQLGIDQFPNVDIPTVLVTTRLPGAAPEQVESEVTDKIEEAVNTISGIDTLTSTSSEGVSQVVVSFRLEKNADVATQEVRDRINRILPLLPRTITQPIIEKRDPDAAPVLTIALTANAPVRDITEYADKVLRRQLESADGVGQVLVLGGRRRQINVVLDADRLRAQNLTVNDVARALQAQNSDIPGGRIDQGAQSLTMRTRGRVESPGRVRGHRHPRGRRIPGAGSRRRPDRRRHGGRADRRERQRRSHGAPANPQAVRDKHGRDRERRQGAPDGARKTRCRPATGFASCAIRPSSSKHRSRASRNTSSSARSSPRSSCSSSSETFDPPSSPPSRFPRPSSRRSVSSGTWASRSTC